MQDTANGADEISHWPEASYLDRVEALGRFVYLLCLAVGLSYPLGQACATILGGDGFIWWAAVALLFFPFFATSSLESQRTLFPVSASVCASLISLWWGWLTVYALSAVLFAGWAASCFLTIDDLPFLTPLWSGPVLAAASLVTARLYGRLLWRAVSRDAEDAPEVREDPWV
jgi:hypothetical protein